MNSAFRYSRGRNMTRVFETSFRWERARLWFCCSATKFIQLRLLPSFVLFHARYLFRPRWSRVSQVFAFKTILNLLTDRDDFSRHGRETKSKCNTIAKVQHTCHRIYFSFNYVANFYEYRVIIRTADIYADLCFCKYNSRNETWTENYSICCVLQKLLHLQYFKIVCILYCQIFYV